MAAIPSTAPRSSRPHWLLPLSLLWLLLFAPAQADTFSTPAPPFRSDTQLYDRAEALTEADHAQLQQALGQFQGQTGIIPILVIDDVVLERTRDIPATHSMRPRLTPSDSPGGNVGLSELTQRALRYRDNYSQFLQQQLAEESPEPFEPDQIPPTLIICLEKQRGILDFSIGNNANILDLPTRAVIDKSYLTQGINSEIDSDQHSSLLLKRVKQFLDHYQSLLQSTPAPDQPAKFSSQILLYVAILGLSLLAIILLLRSSRREPENTAPRTKNIPLPSKEYLPRLKGKKSGGAGANYQFRSHS